MSSPAPYLRALCLKEPTALPDEYPFNLPFVRNLDIEFSSPVTFFVGENGSGKSTLMEGIAGLCQLPISGGSRNELSASHGPETLSRLAPELRGSFQHRPRDAYFLRSEFQAHLASLLDQRKADPDFWDDPYAHYGGRSLLTRSHGEAFLAILENRIQSGLFLFDEPESALSPTRQLTFLAQVSMLAETGTSQFIIATHSPILLTFPGAQILAFDGDRIQQVSLQETSHFRITTGILQNPQSYWRHLQGTDSTEDG